MSKNKSKMDRRNFFSSIARGGIFVGLIGTGGYLKWRPKKSGGTDCNFDFVCQNCSNNNYCKLPEASVFRMNKWKRRADGE